VTEKLRLRCSALPLAFLCPGSVRPSKLPINDTSEAAELGTAAHAGLATLVERGWPDWDGIPELARRHGVGEKDLRILIAQGVKLWESTLPDSDKRVLDCFPDPLTEVELEHEDDAWVLTGHADILGRGPVGVHVGDWKGGRVDKSFREQLRGYGALALLDDRAALWAQASVLWIRDGDVEQYSMQRTELDAWRERIDTEIVGWSGEYRPGPHCAHCDRSHECPAANALMRRDFAVVTDRNLVGYAEDEETLATWTPEAKIDLVEKARVASKLIERVLDALKADVITNGGEISDGKRRLTIVTEPRRYLDPIKAFPVLTEAGFTDEDMAQVIEMTAAKAENVVAERAPKGKAAAAKRELTKALEAADAIQIREFHKMVQKRA
jgi:hypothetical protein